MIRECKLLKSFVNEKVDTHIKVVYGDRDKPEKKIASKSQNNDRVDIYTTAHLGAAHRINDFIVEYLHRKSAAKKANTMAQNISIIEQLEEEKNDNIT